MERLLSALKDMPDPTRQPDATNAEAEYLRACAADLQGQLDRERGVSARLRDERDRAEARERKLADELAGVRWKLQAASRAHNQ